MTDLSALAAEHLAAATAAPRGRSAQLVTNDGPLRQSVIALRGGEQIAEHNAPTAATLQVLLGTVRLTGGPQDLELVAGSLAPVPHARHGVDAVTDAVVLLTTVGT